MSPEDGAQKGGGSDGGGSENTPEGLSEARVNQIIDGALTNRLKGLDKRLTERLLGDDFVTSLREKLGLRAAGDKDGDGGDGGDAGGESEAGTSKTDPEILRRLKAQERELKALQEEKRKRDAAEAAREAQDKARAQLDAVVAALRDARVAEPETLAHGIRAQLVEDETGDLVARTKEGDLSLAEFVARFAKSKPHLVIAQSGGGTGAGGQSSSSKNGRDLKAEYDRALKEGRIGDAIALEQERAWSQDGAPERGRIG